MKKLATLMLVLAMSVFTIGCNGGAEEPVDDANGEAVEEEAVDGEAVDEEPIEE